LIATSRTFSDGDEEFDLMHSNLDSRLQTCDHISLMKNLAIFSLDHTFVRITT